MATGIKQFIISVPTTRNKRPRGFTFFEHAKKHIVKKKKGVSKYLSRDIDKILYGAR